jgi:hypothetical protein
MRQIPCLIPWCGSEEFPQSFAKLVKAIRGGGVSNSLNNCHHHKGTRCTQSHLNLLTSGGLYGLQNY